MSADPRAATVAPPRPRRLRVVRAGERAPRPAGAPRDEAAWLPFEQRVPLAFCAEFLAGSLSLALVAPFGWAALIVMPATMVVLVCWLTR